jgi:hypothetical protein
MSTRFIDVLGRTLDARPDRLDLRDREFTPQLKSLLYLVSRALEPEHKTPLLGLARDVRRLWPAAVDISGNLHVFSRAQVSTGRLGKPIKTSHDCFDNAAEVIDATLRRILERAPRYPVQWLDY